MAIIQADGSRYRLADVAANVRIGGGDSRFVPNLNSSFHIESGSEQYFLNLNRPGGIVKTELPTFDGEALSLDLGPTIDRFHVLDHETVGWDVVYKENPRLTRGDYVEPFILNLSPGLTLHYQGPLTPTEIETGARRPARVVGSYAIYANTVGRIVGRDGNVRINYGCGKVGHIFRPRVVDAARQAAWCGLDYRNGQLLVTIPGAFLDAATYPITLDPDVGYTTAGATNNPIENLMLGPDATPGSTGTITSFSAYVYDSGTHTSTIGLYQTIDSAYAANANARTDIGASQTWYTYTAAGTPAITTQEYAILAYANGGAGNFEVAYDTVGDGGRYQARTWDGALPDPGSFTETPARASVYFTYTESGGSTTHPGRYDGWW